MRWKECTCLFRLGLSLAIKIASSVLLKMNELANAKIFHWKVWPGWDAEWRAGSENFLVSSCSACLIERFRADSPTFKSGFAGRAGAIINDT